MSDTARKLSVSMIVRLYENSKDEKERIFGQSTLTSKAQNQPPMNIDDPTSSKEGEKLSFMKNPSTSEQTSPSATNKWAIGEPFSQKI